VGVPDLREVETLEGAAHQLVARDRRRQAGAAGIPEALLRPKAPGRKRASPGKRGAADKKMTSFQDKNFRRASF
jgi:hypothetical protein